MSREHDVTVVGFRDRELDEGEAFLDFLPRERCLLLSEPDVVNPREFIRLRFLPRWCLSYFSLELKQLIDRLVRSGKFDRVHVSHSYMAWYLLDHIDRIPCVVDHHNVKSQFFDNAYRSTRSWTRKIAYKSEALRWRHYEKEIIPLFNHHYGCSRRECDLLRKMTNKNVRLLPSGVDTAGFQRKSEALCGTNLLFTGSLDYFPNAQAVKHFCGDILPAVRRAVPEVTFQVVGKNPALETERLLEKSSNTWFSYNVRDIRPFYYQSTVFVVPLLTGAGTRLKIMEAMAVGLPVVSTFKGCEGLDLENHEGIVITDEPESMANAIIRLLNDADFRDGMSRKAFEVCQERFSWHKIFEQAGI